ncbi:MAG: A/G-specific adenine glycosylase [Acidobacteriota bacterium]
MDPAKRLLEWYDAKRRDLPWRKTTAWYPVWVSEIMLQQTRVETVVSAYEVFLERFPSVGALAAAPIESVLAVWSGLGYYRRARLLHQAALRVVAQESFPTEVDGLRALPGIGEYTASAIASICFGVATPVLDGNVERVISRRLASADDPKRAATRDGLRAAAASLLDPARPGDSNQALMELGATICTPRAPRCSVCPLGEGCQGLTSGSPTNYPPARVRRVTERQSRVAAIVNRDSRILLVRLPDSSPTLGGTWEIPWVAAEASQSAAEFAERYGGKWSLGPSRGTVKHAITYRAIEVDVREAFLEGGDHVAEGIEAGWFDRAGLGRVPHSSLVEKILRRAASS